jgi:hypothetical protein
MSKLPQPAFLAAMFAAVITTATATADWVWAPAQMVSAEELASSGALAPVAIPTKLSNFRYPFLQDDGSVIFIANDHLKPANAEGRAGIFKIEANDRVSTLASAGEGFTNSDAKLAEVWGLKVEGGRAVFRAVLNNGGSGIALWEDGRLTLLASNQNPEGMSDFGYPDLSEDIVVFSAKPKDSGRSLYAVSLRSADRRPVAVVPNGTPIPGTDGLSFGAFADSQFADGTDAVFRAYSEEFRPFHGPGPRYSGVFRKSTLSTNPPAKIIDLATSLPGAPEDTTFNHYIDSAIPRDGCTAIVNRSGDLRGIYLSSPDGKTELVVDSNTQIPDLFEGSFEWFSKWVYNNPPWLLFLARADNYLGLFALNKEEQALYLLADSRMNFDGKKIVDAEISNSAKIGDKVALMLEFDDGSSGVYLATFGKGLAMHKSPAKTNR